MSEVIEKFEANMDEIVSVFGGEEISIQDLTEQASAYLSTLAPAEQAAGAIYITGLITHIADGFEEEEEEEEDEEEDE